MKLCLKDKNILVTGVGKGIGFSILKTIVSQGGYVYGVTKSKKDLVKFKNINNCQVICGDIKEIRNIKKILFQSIKDKKPISGFVNNAGVRFRKSFLEIKKTDIKKIFDNNFFSIFSSMQLFAKYSLRYNIKISIVNIGSIVGKLGFKDLSLYASSKSALIGLTKSFAVEFAKKNIRANIVLPGFIKTSYYKNFTKKKRLYKWTLDRIPNGEWGSPENVSNLVCFLVSDMSEYINGENISVDGGWTNS